MNQQDRDTLDKDAEEAMKLAREEDESLTLDPTPAPVVAPDPAPNAELEDLKVKLEAANAQVATLTSKLNSEDGRRGGELRTLRESVEQMRAQMQAMADENKRLAEQAKQKQPDPEPSVADSEEDKAFAETFPTRAKREKAEAEARKAELERIKAEAETARKKAEALEQRTVSERVAAFNGAVNAAVKGIEGFDSNAFNVWADATVAGMNADGTTYTYGEAYDVASQTVNASRAIAIVEAYQKTKTPSAAAAEPPKPPKPTKESQAQPSGAGGGSDGTPTPDASKEKAKKAARLKELDYKLGMTGAPRTATVEESKEWDRLMAETTE